MTNEYICDVCGKAFNKPQHLKLHSTTHNKQINNNNNDKPIEQTFSNKTNQSEIENARKELELLRITTEINKLKQPDNSSDMIKLMLEMQTKNYEQMMKLQQEQLNAKLEMEKLRLASEMTGGSFEDTMIEQLLPLLPQILAQRSKAQPSVVKATTTNAPTEQQTRSENMATTKEFKRYMDKLKTGELSDEQMYEDFKTEVPQYAQYISKEQFLHYIKQLQKK